KLYPQNSSQMKNLNERIYDLMNIFRKGLYADPEIKGRYSTAHC
ncbi:MAG: hypothetical protein DRP79_03440, partial [Planctomycetota bacterium]